MEDVTGGCGCRLGVWVNVLVNLIEKNLCGVGVVSALYLLGKDLFAPGREVSVEEGVFVDDARGRGGGELWEQGCGKEKVWTGCD